MAKLNKYDEGGSFSIRTRFDSLKRARYSVFTVLLIFLIAINAIFVMIDPHYVMPIVEIKASFAMLILSTMLMVKLCYTPRIWRTTPLFFTPQSKQNEKQWWGGLVSPAPKHPKQPQPSPTTQQKNQIKAERPSLPSVALVRNALANGDIHPWFQPQIHSVTQKVVGFEALARWLHPHRGLIAPQDFLNIVDEHRLWNALSDAILHCALHALAEWDKANLNVPRIGVNFSAQEMQSTDLVHRIQRALTKHNITADRLVIEVPETIVATCHNSALNTTLTTVRALGCLIDLDDFGAGHASLSSVLNLPIDRVKIDRTFITKMNNSAQHTAKVGAILDMAKQMDLETLAEGVETAEQMDTLKQLGCTYVQGFWIARPMPPVVATEWMQTRHKQSK